MTKIYLDKPDLNVNAEFDAGLIWDVIVGE
jgi:hypothetical protein